MGQGRLRLLVGSNWIVLGLGQVRVRIRVRVRVRARIG